MTKTKILVIDDDPAIRGYLSDFLASRNYSVSTLDSGDKLLDSVGVPDPPALILLDMMMPRHDGLSLLAQLQQTGRNIPVVILSGMGQARTVVSAMRMGASDYILKPFEDEELERAIRGALDSRSLPLVPRIGLEASAHTRRSGILRSFLGREDRPYQRRGLAGCGYRRSSPDSGRNRRRKSARAVHP